MDVYDPYSAGVQLAQLQLQNQRAHQEALQAAPGQMITVTNCGSSPVTFSGGSSLGTPYSTMMFCFRCNTSYMTHQQCLCPGNTQTKEEKKEGNTTMGDILKDIRGFIKENRSVIYSVALCLFVDHIVFKGQFKAKIQDIVEKFLKKAGDKIEGPASGQQ